VTATTQLEYTAQVLQVVYEFLAIMI